MVCQAKAALVDFLRKIDYSFPTVRRDHELESRVKDITSQWPDEASLKPYIITCLAIAEISYSHLLSVEAKAAIAIFTAILAAIDESAISSSHALALPKIFCDGSAMHDTDSRIGRLVKVVAQMWDYYPRTSANTIMASCVNYPNGVFLEAMGVEARVRPYVEYRRWLSGAPEAYSCFVWEKDKCPDERAFIRALPDTIKFLNHANDIMSFYKEILAGDTGTYIYSRAQVTGKSLIETLHELIDETVVATKRARSLLDGEAAKSAWDSFVEGYIQFHVCDPRYRLKEFLNNEYVHYDCY
ncbi:terpenoid synthase [Wolfiporia cocos MD-104 SS10]|uniref:Terpenoid synthase n=1 Tax=Wolfiporia cocos (strain MD-104) TaxID=742152 RepID=A0A2H3IWW4_WOLCO|nr:terpenoid synthase [Wolfiporia cocos MD-104 SS10]